ncbi:TPA: hypothetical protein ACX6SL_003632 [Photobacterium damselae]
MLNTPKKSIYFIFLIFSFIGWGAFFYQNNIHTAKFRYDVLSPDMTVRYVRSIVWYHSRGKLIELKALMGDSSLSDEELMIKIENMLKHRTSVYINEFNHLNTPILNLGDWYNEHFDFDQFLTAINKEVVKRQTPIEIRIDRCTDIMELYQNQTTNQLRQLLNKDSII